MSRDTLPFSVWHAHPGIGPPFVIAERLADGVRPLSRKTTRRDCRAAVSESLARGVA